MQITRKSKAIVNYRARVTMWLTVMALVILRTLSGQCIRWALSLNWTINQVTPSLAPFRAVAPVSKVLPCLVDAEAPTTPIAAQVLVLCLSVGWFSSVMASEYFSVEQTDMSGVVDILSQQYIPFITLIDMNADHHLDLLGTSWDFFTEDRDPTYVWLNDGVCNVFMANEPLAGKRMVKVTARRTKRDWALFIMEIGQSYSHAEKITLVMDNLNTHKAGMGVVTSSISCRGDSSIHITGKLRS